MRKKIYNVLQKIYSIGIIVSLFAGGLPIIPFVVAMFLGGEKGNQIALFLKNQYYPYVVLVSSISVCIGIIAMYVNKQSALSMKTEGKKKDEESKEEETKETEEKVTESDFIA